MNNYKYPWKHPDNERPKAQCYDCGMKYENMQDMVVPDDVWEEINPTYHKGAGLLCPTDWSILGSGTNRISSC